MRCDEFYRKWQAAGNFCEKHPKTAEQIEAYLNKILPLLEAEASKSEILNSESGAIAPQLSETASRPLVSEKDSEVCQKAMEQIVKVAEDKVIEGKKPQVTNREVSQILTAIKGEPASDPVQAVHQWVTEQQARSDMPAIPKYITDLLDFKEIKGLLEELSCPCCGAPASGNLVWKCCGSSLDEAIGKAEAAVDKRFAEVNAVSKAQRTSCSGCGE